MASILKINSLKKSYDDFLLDNISLNLDEGFIMGLIGPNGAGKTTIIKLILNLIRKDSGSIKIFGSNISKNEIELKQKIGFVLEDSGWYETFTIKEMAKIISPFYKEWDKNIFDDYLRRFEIKPEHRIENLSKGPLNFLTGIQLHALTRLKKRNHIFQPSVQIRRNLISASETTSPAGK